MKHSFTKRIISMLPLLAIVFLLNPLIVQSTFAQMGGGDPIPHYFGPYPNYATSDLPVVTYNADGSIASVTGGIEKFIDSLPLLGPQGASTLNSEYLPVAVKDSTTYPGSDYYEIAAVEFYQQFHSDLPWTKVRGYVQIDTAAIPGAGVPLTDRHPTNPQPILMPNGAQAIGVDIPRYLGPFIVAEKDVPVRVKFYNLLPTGAAGNLFLPVDTTVMGSGMGPIDDPMNPGQKLSYTENRATLHLHGGRSPWISDGTAHQWITPANEDTVYPKGVSVVDVPDMPASGPGEMTFYYTNQQSARLMFYHDHSYGITRLNVYAGEAAGYVLRDAVEQSLISAGIIPGNIAGEEIPLVIQDKTFVPRTTGGFTNMYGTFASQLAFQDPTWDVTKWGGTGSLWYPHVYVPMQNPGDPSGMNLIGRWHYGPWFWPPTAVTNGPTANPYAPGGALYDPMYAFNSFEPAMIPGVPNISAPGEAFMDTPVINGVAYPYLEVEPKAYRFRILNAADDRFFNLQLYEASTGIVKKIAVSNGGTGYTTVPTVTITGNGVGATARAVLDGAGHVSAVEVLTVGSGYTIAPTVTITPPATGTTATAYAQIYTAPTEVGMVPAQLTSGYPDGWPIDGREGGVPDPTKAGPAIIQIGNEGGFLPTPVVLENQPIDWNVDMGTFDAGLVNKGTLRIGTAERADVIIDFSQYRGKTLILYNDNPAPEPASDPRQDYYTGRLDMTEGGGCDPIMPGYGSNTRTIMQIKVADVAPDPAYDLAGLETAFASTATTDGVFKQSQEHDIIVPQAAYSSAYNTAFTNTYSRIFDNSLTFTPIGQSSPVTIDFNPKQIQDEMGESYDPEYGRMAVLLGTELKRTNAGQQTMLLYGYAEAPTEIIAPSIEGTQIGTLSDGTQIWKITHNGVDVHTVHWHMFEVQLINRVAWDNNIREPDANELGWKETIRVNPLQDTIVALRPIVPDLPFEVPNSERLIDPTQPEGVTLKNTFDPTGQNIVLTNHVVNFGWEHVWHCHILAHEEMDMMRPLSLAVPPRAPTSATVTTVPTGLQVTWIDNSVSETGYVIQRASNPAFTTGLVSFNAPKNAVSYIDTTAVSGQTYYYRVKAINIVGDTFDYTVTNPQAVGFETMTAESTPSNTAFVINGNQVINTMVQADVNNDGQTEVITGGHYNDGTRNNAQITVRSSSNFAVLYQTSWYWTGDTTINSIAVANVDSDADLEIIAGGNYFDGTRNVAQLTVWSGPTLASENTKPWYWTGATTVNSIAVADVDGDGANEIVTGGSYFDNTRDVAQLVVWSGSTLTVENYKVWYWTGNTVINSVAVANINADANLEIVAGGNYFDGTRNVAQLTVWSGPTLALNGVNVWYWTGNTIINSVAIGDVDGNGSNEIVTGGNYFDNTRDVAQLAVWSGSTLALNNVKTWYWTGNTVINAVAIANTGAGTNIITGGTYVDSPGSSSGQVIAWSGSTLATQAISAWKTGTATYVEAVNSWPTGSISVGYYNDGTKLNEQIMTH